MPRVLLATALVVALAFTASAEHCTTWETYTPFAEAGGYYLIAECGFQCDGYSVWIYEESNGLPGLQREDEVVDNTCHGMVEGDRIIF